MEIFYFSITSFFSLFILSLCINNTNNRILSECHPNCKECSGPPTDSKHMNCLSCIDDFYLYKSNNCFNCSKYINYELTECIDSIPDGYYLQNETIGTLGKCHELCKTCEGPPMPYGMMCIECKYEDENFSPTYETDCPDDIDDEEEYPIPIGQCPREQPILVRKDFCSMVYCTEKEFEDGMCEINNDIIKTQWINKVQRFGEGEIKNICLDNGDNGELFLFGQEKDENDNRWLYIYGIDKNQKPMFIDNDLGKDYYTYFKKINIPYNITLENMKIVKNFEKDQLIIISTQINNSMFVIDYIDNIIIEHKFNQKSFSSKMSDIIYIKNLQDTYFTNFILCTNNDDCHGFIRKFKFVTNNNDISLIKDYTTEIKINPERNFICTESYTDYIQCFYTTLEENEYILDIFDVYDLTQKFTFIIEKELDNTLPFLESMIKLNKDSFIVAYSMKNNVIKVLIKSFNYNNTGLALNLDNYIPEVPYILINNNSYIFEDKTTNRNSLCVLNENKFAILLNVFNSLPKDNYENNQILIYIFSIFNEHKNINMRKYSINFKLYNMVNRGKLLGYTFGDFFGILVELSSPENRNITNAGFITFGYINTINNRYEIYDNNFFPENSTISNPIKAKNYIETTLENNLFGYTFNGVIFLSLINENIGHFFIGYKYKIIERQVININSDVFLELKRNYTPGNYSIEFAGVAGEPKYEERDKYSEEIWYYPNNTDISEKDYYIPNIFIGKSIIYNFEIKKNQIPKQCHPSCSSCVDYSEDDNNQMCTSCREQYYFINGTQNCYNYVKAHYYFDEDTKKYYPCYKDCLTCNKKETSIQNMNCLSCSSDFIFYNKSKNCLKCPNYVSYEQTQCISSVPEGYYILNETLGLIEPCHNLCKTCSKGPINDTVFHMNCDICLYENKNFIPFEKGDCPPNQETETEVKPVGGKCPKNLPILKNNTCYNIYCTQKEYEDKTCVIYNDNVEKQWLNKINIFPNEASNIKYDKGDKGELLLLLTQKKEGNYIENNIDLFLYGFDKKNEGLFYDKNKSEYSSYKKLTTKNKDKYIEKIKYLELDKKGYLLQLFKDNRMFLIDFDSKEKYYALIPRIPHIPTLIGNFQKYINTNNKYLLDYVYCNNNILSSFETCYIGLTNYEITSNNYFDIESKIKELIRVKPDTKLLCINNIFSSKYILCKYNSFELLDEQTFRNDHILTLFDSNTLTIKNKFILDKYFLPNKQVIDAMIPMDDNNSNFIIAYSTSQNIIKILFKTLRNENIELDDLIQGVPKININQDLNYYFKGDVFSNDLTKIDNNFYILMLKTYKNNEHFEEFNTGLLVVTLKIFSFSKVIVRYYHYDMSLYNMNLEGNILGYNLNGFFGALLEFNSEDNKMGKSAFITFGFVNTTNDVSIEEGTRDLIDNKKSIKVSDYILEIENNLFGYDVIGVQILKIPDAQKVGGFLNLKDNYNLIKVKEIISISSELRFNQVNNPIFGNYSISFAGLIKEPSEQIAINLDDKSEYYPINSTKFNYTQKTFMSRIFTYNFALNKAETKCFQNCEECQYVSDDINSQNCLKCKPGFYFVYSTRNCFDKLEHNYYFDKVSKQFYPCYKDCYTCSTKEFNSTYMNCLTCLSPFKFYEKNKNCLKCNKYVNFEQTQCIDTIPNGYYLQDKEKGIIDKCYHLCKSCSKKDFISGGKLYMNCESCIFTNNSKVNIEGNCPETEEKEEEIKEEEGGSTFGVIIGIIISILIIVAISVVIYFKCFKKNKYKSDPSNYLNIEGKNIAFGDDEGDIGIN